MSYNLLDDSLLRGIGCRPEISLLWGKSAKGNDSSVSFHPLLCHMMDVAQVAIRLWAGVLSEGTRERMAGAFGIDQGAMQSWAGYWCGCHDVGKASPVFQGRRREAEEALGGLGFDFPAGDDTRHGQVSASVLKSLLVQDGVASAVTRGLARRIAVTVGGHHGVFPEARDLGPAALGNERWGRARRELVDALASMIDLKGMAIPQALAEDDHAPMMFLAGLTAVADWIGSNRTFFPLGDDGWKQEAYWKKAGEQADRALNELGWLGWRAQRREAKSFERLFGFAPRPLQCAIAAEAAKLDRPALVLIEAPMGEGKTEAALYMADRWNRAGGQGMYVALPTMATSNGMFGRVEKFAREAYPEARVNLHLLHGHAMLSGQYDKLKLAAIGEDREGRVVAESWFSQNKKQAMLAPFGVGTIDQALLSVLQTKHVFVRLFGLAGKTVILDEVHAYDAYMSTIMCRLLEWLAALGCPVVLLSATLPAERRRMLLEAYAGKPVDMPVVAYPRVTVVYQGSARVEHVEADPARAKEIALEWNEKRDLAEELGQALEGGGCAAVICNTVGEAQHMYLELRDALRPGGVEVELFHARFPFGRRDEIEKRVLERYGKNGTKRPHRAVLVATQVVEQSLDLDFDLMVSEMAPVDLVLQRAGRLHRHERKRPTGVERPRLWLLTPEAGKDGVPDFGVNAIIYEEYVLLRSYLELIDRSVVRLPGDLEEMVEGVYGGEAVVEGAWRDRLEVAKAKMLETAREARLQGKGVVIGSPHDADDILLDFNQQLEEDNPEAHRRIQAATRLAEPSVAVVFLHKVGGQMCLDRAGRESVEMAARPDVAMTRALLRNTVTLSHAGIVHKLVAQGVPETWRENSLLRFHRVLELNAGGASVGKYAVTVDDELGVMVRQMNAGGPDGEF